MPVPVQVAEAEAVALAKAQPSSYGQILKSSSLIGGAQAITLVIGMVRTKVVAVLLGPSGVGLVGLFQSATAMLGTVAGLGIAQSAVRQVAEAQGTHDQQTIARTVTVLRRVCWVTGLMGWLLTTAVAYPLSLWTFRDKGRAWAVAILGATLLIGSISSGQSALLQGLRRVADLARLQILSAIASTIVSVALYAWLGEQGIIPVLVITALVNLGFSWWVARAVPIMPVGLCLAATALEARRFVSLGLAFMWSGLLTTGVALLTQSLIARRLGIDANGIYQAAWAISGVFAGFILTAMGTDFYPRLTAAATNREQMNRLVNEQTEVGILLALPGLVATLIFSPLIIRLLYTSKFVPAAQILPWFVLGVCGRVISWPLAYIFLAQGKSRTYAATETVFNVLHVVLIWVALRWLGFRGVGVAFAAMYALYTVSMLWLAAARVGFRWSPPATKLIAKATVLVTVAFLITLLPFTAAAPGGIVMVLLTCGYCLRQLLLRLGSKHRLWRLIGRLPILRGLLLAA